MFNQKFIVVFEGIDGSGKTTQCEMLCGYLNRQGIRNRYEKFPGDCFLDKSMLNKIKDNCTDKELYYKFITAMRAYEASKNSFMNLLKDSNYEIVVCDRYKYTDNVNLQIDGAKEEIIYLLSNWLPDLDLLFYLDIDINVAMKRIRSRGRKIHWHENEEYLSRLSNCFRKEFESANTNLYKLDASKNIDSLYTEIISAFIDSMTKVDCSLFVQTTDNSAMYHLI
jgi:dTMP kinase